VITLIMTSIFVTYITLIKIIRPNNQLTDIRPISLYH